MKLLIDVAICFATLMFSTQLAAASTCPRDTETLRVSILDVGQGSAVLVTCPDNKTQMLVDAGNRNENYPNAEQMFLDSFFSAMGSDRILEYAVLTHPDIDHLFGFINLLNKDNFTISNFIDSGLKLSGKDEDEQLIKLIKENKVNYVDVVENNLDSVSLCEGLDIDFFFPKGEQRKQFNCDISINDCSIVAKLSFGGVKLLLMGDLTDKFELKLLGNSDIDADFLLLGHHGVNSTTDDFLDLVTPILVGISAGVRTRFIPEKWGYPQKRVIERVNKYFTRLPVLPTVSIPVCQFVKGACTWSDVNSSLRVLSTAQFGTINLFVSKDNLCAEAQGLSGAWEY